MAEIHQVLTVQRTLPDGDDGVTLILAGQLATAAEPGQFVMVWLPGVEERPFTLVNDSPVMLTVGRVGPFSRALSDLEPGARIWLRGPYGRGFPEVAGALLLIGGGTGAAALCLAARRTLSRGNTVDAVLGARSADRLMLRWHLGAIGAEVHLATDDGSVGYHGTAVARAEELLRSRHYDAVYVCGPEAMIRAAVALCESQGLPVWASLERAMKCGIGVCGNCHCGDRLVCRDGPVFDGQTVASLLA